MSLLSLHRPRAAGLAAASGVLVLAALAACSAEDADGAGDDVTGACDAIASLCHGYDAQGGVAAECHDLGHDGDDAKCAARRDACAAACPKRAGGDGGTTADATADGAPGTNADAAPSDATCTALCACLTEVCAAFAGYPFASTGSCESTCATYGAAERTCYPKWCTKAKIAPSAHNCEHAWGGLGTAECDAL